MNPSTNGRSRVAGAGIDSDPARRPGVPMEAEPPRPVGAAHWNEPERQPDPGGILRRKDLAHLTPVFGTSVAPRGLSGLMRRLAYQRPEHATSHWLVLLLADRVDALEERALRAGRVLAITAPIVAGAALAMGLVRRRRRRWFAWAR